jgi:protoporphyrinogen/coproporphyrinogen III oxidase
MRVIVVGGGIAGLVTAWRIADGARRREDPLEVLLLEAESHAGGHAWTTREDGFVVEAGPNGWLDRPREPHMREMIRELGLEGRLVEAREAAKRRFVLDGGRLRRAPDSPPTLIASDALSPLGKLRLLLEPWARPAVADREETVYEFACRRIGREAAERLVDAAVSGISAGDSRRLSVRAAFPLMVEMERDHGSLIRAMMALAKAGKSRLVGVEGGMSTLVDTLRARLAESARLGRPVVRIERMGERWSVVCEAGVSFDADRIVLALSAARASQLVKHVDAELAITLSGFPYAGLAMVALAYRVPDVGRSLDGYGYLVARKEGLDTLGVLWESSIFEGRAPEGFALLRVMMGGTRRPEVVGLEEAELVARARRELAAPLRLRAEPARAWVRRWPAAIAQYEVGHLARVAEARRLAARHGGLDLCGSSYDGASLSSAVRSGMEAAERVGGAREAAPSGVGVS